MYDLKKLNFCFAACLKSLRLSSSTFKIIFPRITDFFPQFSSSLFNFFHNLQIWCSKHEEEEKQLKEILIYLHSHHGKLIELSRLELMKVISRQKACLEGLRAIFIEIILLPSVKFNFQMTKKRFTWESRIKCSLHLKQIYWKSIFFVTPWSWQMNFLIWTCGVEGATESPYSHLYCLFDGNSIIKWQGDLGIKQTIP